MDPELIRSLRGREGVREGAVERGLELALAPPTGPEWRAFLDRSLAGLGALLVLAGVFFFFAYNWKALGKFGKFGLLEATLVALFWLGRSQRLALAAASALIGALLAVYGQTYQTGADSWQLFALWAALSLPWVLAADFKPLWLGWIALVNVAAWLGDLPAFAIAGLNLVGWSVSEVRRVRSAWFTPTLSVLTMGWMLYGAADEIFGNDGLALACFGFLAIVIALYRARRGLFFLAAAAGSLIFLLTCLIIRAMGSLEDPFHWLMLALTIVAQLAVAASWLRFEARR